MLLIGYGNAGRGDDGLGPAFAERVASANLPGLDVDIDYQLTVDHAADVAAAKAVIFADATLNGEAPFSFARLKGEAAQSLSSHSLTPATVLTLSETLFGHRPMAFVLGIRGYEFGEVREGLSDGARRNIGAAEAFFVDWYARQFTEAADLTM